MSSKYFCDWCQSEIKERDLAQRRTATGDLSGARRKLFMPRPDDPKMQFCVIVTSISGDLCIGCVKRMIQAAVEDRA